MDFGEYAELYDEPSHTNSIKSLTWKCVGLGTSGNIQD